MSLELAVQAYLLGWTVAAPIGPVNLEIIRRALRYRLLAGFLVGLGATMIDLTYMLLTSFGLASLLQNKLFLTISLSAGALLLGWLAFMALRDGFRELRKPRTANVDADNREHTSRGELLRSWIVGLGMTAANPMTLVFWSTLPSLFYHDFHPTRGEILILASLVWLGTISWVGLLMLLIKVARRAVGHRLFGWASLCGGAAMLYFGLKFLWLAIK